MKPWELWNEIRNIARDVKRIREDVEKLREHFNAR